MFTRKSNNTLLECSCFNPLVYQYLKRHTSGDSFILEKKKLYCLYEILKPFPCLANKNKNTMVNDFTKKVYN